ncbi:MAG: redoxin domain-containing protein [Nitrospirae bacterium]|nr:redoxin domain-containing protein [Nitrospirota bacterium]
MSNKTIFLLASILAAVVLVFNVYAKKKPEDEEADRLFDSLKRPIEWQGRTAPEFEIRLLNGEDFRLSDVIGQKVVVLNFFATWCGPCKDEMPELNSYIEKHEGDQIIFVGINADEKEDKVKDFISEQSVRFPVAIDRDSRVQKLFGVTGFPTTIFIGVDGTVHIYEIGPVMNADIAFDAAYKNNLGILKTGKAISKDIYHKKLEELQRSKPLSAEGKEDEQVLTGRAKEIAAKMYCPCGCEDILIECNCKTAKEIRARLKTEALSSKTDEEIIKALNKEFCVRGKKTGHDQS